MAVFLLLHLTPKPSGHFDKLLSSTQKATLTNRRTAYHDIDTHLNPHCAESNVIMKEVYFARGNLIEFPRPNIAPRQNL